MNKRNAWRWLGLVVALVMVMGALPTTANAQNPPPPQTTAVDPEASVAPVPEWAMLPKTPAAGIEYIGGPDGYGYYYMDSLQAGGPTFSWVDATGGTNLGLDDTTEANITLPFNFTYYGVSSNALRVGNNGAVLFGVTTGDVADGNSCPLSGSTTSNILGPWWDDWASTGEVYWQTFGSEPNRYVVVEWYNMVHYTAAGTDYATFEMILYEGSTDIIFQYLDTDVTGTAYDNGLSGTAGIRQSSAANTLQYRTCNTNHLAANLAIRFFYAEAPVLATSYKSAPTTVLMGDEIDYTVHIINTGTLTATNAAMSDLIPTGTTYVAGSVVCSAGTCQYLPGTDEITWTGVVSVATSVLVTFTVDTDGAPCGTNVVNTAVLTDPDLPLGSVSVQATTQVVYELPFLEEGFENATFPPTGWAKYQTGDAADPGWLRGTAAGASHSGLGYAWHNDDNLTTSAIAWLVTPQIALPAGSLPQFTFWDRTYYTYPNYHGVWISTGSGDPTAGQFVELLNLTTSKPTVWTQRTVDLSSYAGQNVYIAFRYEGDWADEWYIDDVRVANPWSPCPHVSLGPDQVGYACPGSTANYVLPVVNANDISDTLDLSWSSTWPTTISPSSFALDRGAAGTANASVYVPWASQVGDSDTASVLVTGQASGLSDAALLNTTVPLASGWTDLANAPHSVRQSSVVYYDGKLYVIGGYDGSARAYVDIYDIASNTWTSGAAVPAATSWWDCVEIGGKIYCAGGYTTSGQTTLRIYDIANNSWSTGASMSAMRYSYAGVALNGLYYVIGGYTGSYQSTIWAYNPISDTWNYSLPNMTIARRYHMAGVIDGRIYVVGGYSGSYQNTVEIFDPATNSWSTGTPMPLPWMNAADGVKHDRFLVLSGGGSTSTSAQTNRAWAYDALLDTWTELPNLPRALYAAEGDSDGSHFWMVGGYSGSSYIGNTTRMEQCASCVEVSGADFTVTPSTPRPNIAATFAGSVAAGSPAITWEWDFGDLTTGSGQTVDHTYAAVGTYTVVMTATNCDGAGVSVVSYDVTVQSGPIIEVTPESFFDIVLCPDAQTTEDLVVCNIGDEPLNWSLAEVVWPPIVGAASIPPLQAAPGNSADASAFPAVESENHILANSVLIIQDQYPWGYSSIQNILTANGIAYDQVGSSQMATIDLTPYELVIIPSNQDGAFYATWNANIVKFEAYVAAGGALWLGTATYFATSPDPLLPGGVALIDDVGDNYNVVVAPAHPWVAGVTSPFYGNYASHGQFTNLYPGSIVVTTDQNLGSLPTLVDYAFGAGRVLITAQPLEHMWANGYSGGPILQNSLLDMAPADVIPWLSEDPTSGELGSGACETVTVTFDATGLAPDTYTGALEITSNDTQNPTVTVPVELVVAGPPTNVDFTWNPLNPWVGQDTTFTGSADSLVPVTYGWDFGDASTDSGQIVTHAFAASGDYLVTLTATGCGAEVAEHTVTVPDCQYNIPTEQFEGAFPPQGWQVINNGGTCVWQRNDQWATPRPNYAGTGFCADADSDRCGSGTTMDTELRTYALDLSAETTATLQYLTAYNDIATGGDFADVDISVDGGTTWTNLLHWDADHAAYGPGELVNLDLTPYTGNANVLIRFHYYLATYDWWWEVDDVQVGSCYLPNAVPDIDVTPTSLYQMLNPDQTADQTVNVANLDIGRLNYTFDVGCGTPVGWLSIAPGSGSLAGHSDADATVTFDSTGLAIGTYNTNICVDSNDPDEPQVQIAATLEVTGTPDIAVTVPEPLDVTLCPDSTDTRSIIICNEGTNTLEWEMSELPVGAIVNVVPSLSAAPAAPDAPPAVITSPEECAAYENSVEREPLGWAEYCTDGFVLPKSGGSAPLAPTDIGYAQDIGYISDNFVSFPLNNFTGQTVLGTSTNAYYGIDFDPSGTILYALNDTNDTLGTIDLTNGAYTPLVSCPPGGGAANWTGLSIDPTTGVFYASTATDLYTIDPSTGNSTLVGAFGTTTMIAIAVNAEGQMYGHDITSDSIYQINPATGAATLIGPTGYAANYAQGMDFDNDDGTLYIFLYIGSGANVYGTVNLTTGAVTPLAVSAPLGEFEGATQTTAVAPDIPWLSESPVTGTLGVGGCVTVEVTYDSTGLAPDLYLGDLLIESNDPDEPEITLPVSLTVLEPVDIVSLTSNSPVIIGTPMQFHAVVNGAEPIDLTWDFGGAGTPDLTDPYNPTFLYDATGIYQVTLTAENDCGTDVETITVEVYGEPDIVVDPLSLSAELCPDETEDQIVTICNDGVIPLDWSLAEQPVDRALGSLPLYGPRPDDILWDQPTLETQGGVSDDFPPEAWGAFSADDFVNDVSWAIDTIFVPGWQYYGSMYNATALHWCIYPDSGGVPAGDPYAGGEYWCWSTLPTDPAVTIGGTYAGDVTLNVVAALGAPLQLPPGTWWLAFYPEFTNSNNDWWYWFFADETDNYSAAQFIDPTDYFGTGATSWTAWYIVGVPMWDLGFRLEGSAFDVPWLSEDPTSGTVLPGECVSVTVTFDSTGLTPGDYFANLAITSNDPDTPEVILPVSLTVLEPVDIVSLTSNSPVPLGTAVQFNAVVNGAEPINLTWDFGGAGTPDLTDPYNPTFLYDAPGTYQVTLTAENDCGIDVETITVEVYSTCVPVTEASFVWTPLKPFEDELATFTGDYAPISATTPIDFAWDFGDGNTGSGQIVTHAFDVLGTYPVALTVSNPCSQVTVVNDVQVYYWLYLPFVFRNAPAP